MQSRGVRLPATRPDGNASGGPMSARSPSPVYASASSERANVRVVFLTDIKTPYMLAVFEELARRTDLHVVFCSESGDRGAEWRFEPPSFSHEVVGGAAIRRGADLITYYLSPRIALAIRRARPEAVIAAGFSVPTLYAAAVTLPARVPLLIHSDGTSFHERSLSRAQRAARAVLLRVATACVANSVPAADRFIELGAREDRVFLAPHSTDIARFHAVAEEREQGGSRSSIRVLAVSRLLPRKGVDRLIAAVARAAAAEPAIELRVVGAGPDEDDLRRQVEALGIADRVELTGFVDQDELPGLYRDADVFAFPTLDDPFGFVVLEAAAAGLPIVASPWGGATGDLVRDGETGLVRDPHDVEGFAAALVTLARDQTLRRRLGQAAHASTLERTPAAAAEGFAAAVLDSTARPGRAMPLAGRR
jgi:glycosyltransferase involved in cell wall biosynthesis